MGCSLHVSLMVVALLALLPTLPSLELIDDEYLDRPTRKADLRHPPSPCPSVFSYEGQQAEKEQWFGVILVTTNEQLTGLRLDVKMDRPATLLGNWIGEVKSKDNVRFTILNLNQQVLPGPPLSVRIFAKFPQNEKIPRIQTIQFNGRQICPSHDVPITSKPVIITTSTTTTRRPVLISPETDYEGEPPIRVDRDVECGQIAIQPKPLITHGQSTARGQFPWHAALYHSKEIDLKYICGGSLISHRTVITAAHCVMKPNVVRPVDPESLLVYLGKYHLKQWSEGGVQDKQVVEVYVHPSYNSSNYQSDLAVLTLSSPVEFTTFVRPVCLWDRDKTGLDNVVDKEGIVVGWGYDETGRVTEELKMATMPVVSQQVCLWSNRDFFPHFTSNMTYCAGFRNGSSVCNGDSGGGMVFPRKNRDGSETWMLRGIVSLSKPKENVAICDTKHFVVFTDTAKYLDWIQRHIK